MTKKEFKEEMSELLEEFLNDLPPPKTIYEVIWQPKENSNTQNLLFSTKEKAIEGVADLTSQPETRWATYVKRMVF